MNEPIEFVYFNWLCAKITDIKTPPGMYLDLMRLLYRTEFIWLKNIPGDENRVEDGRELRDDFLRELKFNKEFFWYESPVSVFEVLIAFSYRASFQTNMSVSEWFWKMIQNLGLESYRVISDDEDDNDLYMIDRILNTWMWRIYDPSGYGGLFPLHNPSSDQTKVEIWYQFCEYIYEQGLI